jgi:plastocyanin
MSSRTQRFVNRTLVLLGVGLVFATGIVLVAHQGQRGNADARATAAPVKAVDKVDIKDFLFTPSAITVAVGVKITFTNSDSAPHTATSGASPNADGVFDTGTLTKGQSKSVTVTKAGTYAYYCAIHPFMKASVTVR